MCYTDTLPSNTHSFLNLWVLVARTRTHTHRQMQTTWKIVGWNKQLWPTSPVEFEEFICCDQTFQLVKCWKRTSTSRRRPQVSSAGGRGEVRSFHLILCSHKTKNKRILHSGGLRLTVRQSHWNVPVSKSKLRWRQSLSRVTHEAFL